MTLVPLTNKKKQTQECSVTTRITVLWGDYSFTWYRYGCIWSWLYSFTQLWKIIIINITQQNRHERQKQNNFRNPNCHRVESYLLFSEKEMLIKSFIRFHTFTSCDITSIFWRKGKVHLLHFILEDLDFIATFLELGNNWEIDNNTLLNAGSFVFTMYGCISFNNANMSGMSRYYVMLNPILFISNSYRIFKKDWKVAARLENIYHYLSRKISKVTLETFSSMYLNLGVLYADHGAK